MLIYRTEQGLALQDGNQLNILAEQDTALDAHLGALDNLANRDVASSLAFDESLTWRPLLERPGKFIIIGLNYRAHVEEIGAKIPEKLLFAVAPGSARHSAGADVTLQGEETDYEGEIGIVVGKHADNVSAENAWDYIAGITPLNDVSARDVQAGRTMEAVAQAKGFPGFKPTGPWFATPDEFPDKDQITLKTWVNGDLRQTAYSGDMIFSIPDLVSLVSAKTPLEVGDVICTGTPGGVAHGGEHPYLVDGDEVVIQLGELPPLRNRFVS